MDKKKQKKPSVAETAMEDGAVEEDDATRPIFRVSPTPPDPTPRPANVEAVRVLRVAGRPSVRRLPAKVRRGGPTVRSRGKR